MRPALLAVAERVALEASARRAGSVRLVLDRLLDEPAIDIIGVTGTGVGQNGAPKSVLVGGLASPEEGQVCSLHE
jgi:hypothetical protein